MKCYGYNYDSDELLELREVTIQADPKILREISKFIINCAEEIEKNNDDWEHEHFKDNSTILDESCSDIIVCKK